MKRQVIDEFGHKKFYCSKCGEQVFEFNDVCQTCGMDISITQESRTFTYKEPEEEPGTTYLVSKILLNDEGYDYIYAELEEAMGFGKFSFLTKNATPSIYVFNKDLHNIYVGKQLNIGQGQMTSFTVTPTYCGNTVFIRVYYLKNDFLDGNDCHIKNFSPYHYLRLLLG